MTSNDSESTKGPGAAHEALLDREVEETLARGLGNTQVRGADEASVLRPIPCDLPIANTLQRVGANRECRILRSSREDRKVNKDAVAQVRRFEVTTQVQSPRLLGDAPEGIVLTVVLGLDETLVNNRRLDLPEAILRPYALETLTALRQLKGVEVVLWTAATEEYAAPVVRQLSAQGTVFHDVVFRNDAWFTEPFYAKDLRLLGREMDRVVTFDNAASSCKFNKAHSVLVEDFTGYPSPNDHTLINVFRIAEVLARDIRAGSCVPDSLGRLADEKALCRRVDVELPPAWRHVDVDQLHPLRVPPFGTFFKASASAL